MYRLVFIGKYIRKVYLLLPLFLLLAIIYIPFVLNFFLSNTEMLDNRELKQRPKQFTLHFPQDFTDYYNDTFAGRKKLIVKYVKLKQKLKIDTGQYFYGQEDWMFYDSAKVNNGNSMLGYYGVARFDDATLEQLLSSLKLEKSFFEQFGARYILMVIPDKENVYSEYMPLNMQKARVSDVALSDVAISYLESHSDIDVLRMKPILLQAKQKTSYLLYYPKDTHWNGIGAYIGFEALSDRLEKESLAVPLTDDMVQAGELVEQDMHPTDKTVRYTVSYLPNATYEKREIIPQQLIVYENKKAPLGQTILFAGDSFAEALLPYLAKTYRRIVSVPAGIKDVAFYERVLEEYRPNIVVHELIERYFVKLPDRGKVFAKWRKN